MATRDVTGSVERRAVPEPHAEPPPLAFNVANPVTDVVERMPWGSGTAVRKVIQSMGLPV